MLLFIVRRLLVSIPVIIVASLLLFLFVRWTYDPTARLSNSRDPAARVREAERLGLDKPVIVQYGKWLGEFATGDWGESSQTREEVTTMTWRAFGYTLQLIFWGILLSGAFAIAIGVFSAVRQYSIPDYLITGGSYIAIAMPPFWFGLIAINVLVFKSQDWLWFDKPPLYFVGLHSVGKSGINLDYFRHLVLPVLTLSVQIIGSWSRFQRAAMLDVLSADYIRTARAKGVPRRQVIVRHGMRNALIPLVTVMAVDIGLLFGGLIITESIFSVPGMGRMFFNALQVGDVNVIEAWLVVVAIFVILFNLLADVLYGVLDPRIRLS
jgi:peptide/nickel transport system permease protein